MPEPSSAAIPDLSDARWAQISAMLDDRDRASGQKRFHKLTDLQIARPEVVAKGPNHYCKAVAPSYAATTWAEKSIGYSPRWAAGLFYQLAADMLPLEREWYWTAAMLDSHPRDERAKWAVLLAASESFMTDSQAAAVRAVITRDLPQVLLQASRSLAVSFLERYGETLPQYARDVLEADIVARRGEAQPGVASGG